MQSILKRINNSDKSIIPLSEVFRIKIINRFFLKIITNDRYIVLQIFVYFLVLCKYARGVVANKTLGNITNRWVFRHSYFFEIFFNGQTGYIGKLKNESFIKVIYKIGYGVPNTKFCIFSICFSGRFKKIGCMTQSSGSYLFS